MVSDSTWASWETTQGGRQLTNLGFGSGSLVDRLVNAYRTVDAVGPLA